MSVGADLDSGMGYKGSSVMDSYVEDHHDSPAWVRSVPFEEFKKAFVSMDRIQMILNRRHGLKISLAT